MKVAPFNDVAVQLKCSNCGLPTNQVGLMASCCSAVDHGGAKNNNSQKGMENETFSMLAAILCSPRQISRKLCTVYEMVSFMQQ